jgi:hypothetical protein
MHVKELQVGDKVMTEDGKIEMIRHIGKGMIRGLICLDYKSGRWSEVHPDDKIEIEE